MQQSIASGIATAPLRWAHRAPAFGIDRDGPHRAELGTGLWWKGPCCTNTQLHQTVFSAAHTQAFLAWYSAKAVTEAQTDMSELYLWPGLVAQFAHKGYRPLCCAQQLRGLAPRLLLLESVALCMCVAVPNRALPCPTALVGSACMLAQLHTITPI